MLSGNLLNFLGTIMMFILISLQITQIKSLQKNRVIIVPSPTLVTNFNLVRFKSTIDIFSCKTSCLKLDYILPHISYHYCISVFRFILWMVKILSTILSMSCMKSPNICICPFLNTTKS